MITPIMISPNINGTKTKIVHIVCIINEISTLKTPTKINAKFIRQNKKNPEYVRLFICLLLLV